MMDLFIGLGLLLLVLVLFSLFCMKMPKGSEAMSGVAAAQLGIINNAPGTASPIPGLLAPFAFNDPVKVLIAVGCAIVSGLIGGLLVSEVFLQRQKRAK